MASLRAQKRVVQAAAHLRADCAAVELGPGALSGMLDLNFVFSNRRAVGRLTGAAQVDGIADANVAHGWWGRRKHPNRGTCLTALLRVPKADIVHYSWLKAL